MTTKSAQPYLLPFNPLARQAGFIPTKDYRWSRIVRYFA